MLSSDVFGLSPEDFEREARRLRRLARGLLYDEQASEDVVQEAWLAALRNRGAIRGGSLGAWLSGTVRNLALGRRRREARLAHRETRGARPEAVEGADAVTERIDLSRRLLDALDALPVHYRTVVALRYLDELPPRAIARRLDVPVATVHTRLARGLAKLRAELDPGDDEGRVRMLSALLPLAGAPPVGLPWPGTGSESTAELAPLIGSLTMSKKTLGIVLALLFLVAVPLGIRWSGGPGSSDVDTDRELVAEVALPPVDVAQDEGAADEAEFAPEPTQTRQAVEVAAAEGWTVRGRVIDAEGAGLAGVEVELVTRAGYDERGAELSRVRTWSEADGALAWALDELQGPVHMEARSLGDLHSVDDGVRVLTGEGPPQNLLVRTRPLDVELEGTVVDEDGRPIAGASVASRTTEVTTDARGRFVTRTSSSISGDRLQVRAAGFAERSVLVGDREPGRAPMDVIELTRDRVLRGRVLDESGMPVAGARVSSSLWQGRETETAVDGRFQLGGYHDSQDWPRLVVEARGYALLDRPVERDQMDSELELVLSRGAELVGRVLDADGNPVEAAFVCVGNPPDTIPSRSAWSDASGAFRVTDIPPGAQPVWVERDGWAPLNETVAFTSEETETRDLVLEAGLTLGGIVRDDRGVPVESAWVYASLEHVRGTSGHTSTRTDADGRFTLTDLTPGRYVVGALANGFSRCEVDGLEAGRHDHELVLTSSGRIAGRAVDGRTGEPLDAFTVELVRPSLEEGDEELYGYWIGWSTGVPFRDTDGNFDCDREELASGRAIGVRVSAEGYAPTTVPRVLTAPDFDPEALVIALYPGVDLVGQVVDELSGEPLPDARVLLLTVDPTQHDWDQDGLEATLDANARFRYEQVHAGPCWLMAQHPDRTEVVDGPFLAGPGGESEARTLALGRGASAVIRVRSESMPLADAGVSIHPVEVLAQTWWSRTEQTDAAGEARFDNLAAGRYRARWYEERDELQTTELSHEFEVGADGVVEVDLAHTGTATLDGTVTLESGSGTPSLAIVTLSPRTTDGATDESRSTRTVFAIDGHFEAREVEAGSYLVHAFSPALSISSQTAEAVDLEDGGSATVHVQMR